MYKAICHILNVEHNLLFASSSAWYEAIVDAIETSMTNKYYNDENQYDLLQLTRLIVQYRQILCGLQASPPLIADNRVQDVCTSEQIEKSLALFLK